VVLPGHVAVLSGELEEELPDWEVRVGPREAVVEGLHFILIFYITLQLDRRCLLRIEQCMTTASAQYRYKKDYCQI